jgi:hypothetical protein
VPRDGLGQSRRQRLNIKKKFALALAAYAVLGLLAWQTLSNDSIQVFDVDVKLRTGTLIVLGLFAFRTMLYFWRVRIEEAGARNSSEASE